MKELLIPVGCFESLIVTVKSGADAVYLGGKKFGARAYANNFDDEEMIRAIKYCHLYGVKIYVTVNTLVHESELDEVLSYVKFLHINGVDAVIVQDIGLIVKLRKILPNLEIHASTQVHNTNQAGIDYLHSLGVTRVVLARELSLEEINALDTSLEIEAFVHGDLCVSYSGECLFSSILMNRSGNRGMCAQLCRLPYKLMEDDKIVETKGDYLLSPKSLNTADNFNEVMASNIYSLKIEGRMKGPAYVGCVTRLYREMIDEYFQVGSCSPRIETLNDLKTIFNREYTRGFLFNANNQEFMNINTSNHLGVSVGKVVDVDKKYVWIKLDKELNQGDGIRFKSINEGMICNFIYDKHERLINHAESGEVILLDKKFFIPENEEVLKTLDVKIQDKYINVEDKKINIDMFFKGSANEKMQLILDDGINKVEVKYGMVEVAKSIPMDKMRILKQLAKLGSTPFTLNQCEINIDDNIFINIKDLNEIRRMATSELISLRENKKKDVIINDDCSIYHGNYYDMKAIGVLVRNEEQLRCAIDNQVDRIYVPKKSLYHKYKEHKNVLYRTDRVNNFHQDYGLITELGALKNKGIGDYYLNVTNHETIDEFSKYLDIITLSVELSDDEILNIMEYYQNQVNVEIIVRSYLELMLTKYCPINLNVNKSRNCSLCLNDHKYYLVDRFDKKYRILTDPDNHITHIMNYRYLDKFDKVDFYKQIGINNYRIELLDEDYQETDDLIKKLKELLK